MANDKYFSTFQHREVILKGVPVIVEFYFHTAIASTEWEEGVPEEIEIDRVMVDDINIINLMGSYTLEELEAELWKLYDKRGEGN